MLSFPRQRGQGWDPTPTLADTRIVPMPLSAETIWGLHQDSADDMSQEPNDPNDSFQGAG